MVVKVIRTHIYQRLVSNEPFRFGRSVGKRALFRRAPGGEVFDAIDLDGKFYFACLPSSSYPK